MSEAEKQELSNRRSSLMMQYQQAQLEGRFDDAQFLLTEVDKIDKQMRGSSDNNGNPLKALVLLVPSLVLGSMFFLLTMNSLEAIGLTEEE